METRTIEAIEFLGGNTWSVTWTTPLVDGKPVEFGLHVRAPLNTPDVPTPIRLTPTESLSFLRLYFQLDQEREERKREEREREEREQRHREQREQREHEQREQREQREREQREQWERGKKYLMRLLRSMQLLLKASTPIESLLLDILSSAVFIILAILALELLGWFLFLGLLVTILTYLLLIISLAPTDLNASAFARQISKRPQKLTTSVTRLSRSLVDRQVECATQGVTRGGVTRAMLFAREG
ncbi:hypothetical protein R3P38DRAFT_3120372 [Favolaschia claudopus]|uniref:Uncharacterized protein n=1 Tax=Favolaschia claudopus TaxID=2862362 RepID=A0AAV9ZCW4_9AGAR